MLDSLPRSLHGSDSDFAAGAPNRWYRIERQSRAKFTVYFPRTASRFWNMLLFSSRRLSAFYSVGSLIGILGLFVSLFILGKSVMQDISELYFSASADLLDPVKVQKHVKSAPSLVPFVPGVTVSFSFFPFYIAALVVAVAIHEWGHAIAANVEKIGIRGAGIVVWYGVPGAYVDMEDGELARASHRTRFRVYSAGVFHNLLLAVIAWMGIMCFPYVASLFYSQIRGVAVVSVPPAFLGFSRQLQPNDVILSVARCHVTSMESYYNCLVNFKESYPVAIGPQEIISLVFEVQRDSKIEEFSDGFHWSDLVQDLRVSPYVPRPGIKFLPFSFEAPRWTLDFLSMLTSVSVSLALLNCVACWMLDGFHVWTTLVSYLADKRNLQGRSLNDLWAAHRVFVYLSAGLMCLGVVFSSIRFAKGI
eukprot:ANDGO_00249.mRNA.1 Membrane-bound transcription factor site-2 protease homolog